MNRKALVFLAVLALVLPSLAAAQDDDTETKGSVWGRYQVRQSIEFGGRITESNGNQQMYDTLVNLQSGPRLLGQELSMRSTDRSGGLFDTLNLSSFGLGGDPNDLIRLRVEKNKLYNFVGLYRRDQNFFDYNLWANPLNVVYPLSPLTANPGYVNSPHMQSTTRNMGDFNLTLFPQSAIRFRLGYSRNDNQGKDASTQESAQADLLNNYRMRSDRYTFGVDVRPFKRTTISFDQSFVHDKVDNNQALNPLFGGNFFNVPINATTTVGPANIGLPYAFAPYSFPCTSNSVVNGAIGTIASPCNIGVYNYTFADNIRTDIPTSQLSLQSNYFRKLDITASGSYSDANMTASNISNLTNQISSRGSPLSYLFGAANAERITGSADLGLTYHISKAWKVSNQFRWLNWHDPASLATTTDSCLSTATSANTNLTTPFALGKTNQGCLVPSSILSTLVGPAPLLANPAAAGTIQTGASSLTFLGERTYFDTTKLSWDPSRKLSAYIGYRYGRLEFDNKGTPDAQVGTGAVITPLSLSTSGVITNGTPTPSTVVVLTPMVAKVDEHTALGGVVLRPISAWRINADVELLYADSCSGCGLPLGNSSFNTTAFTNISPRHEQRYRAGSTYKFKKWVTLNASVHIIESRNDYGAANTGSTNLFAYQTAGNTSAYGNLSHNRTYTLGFSVDPSRKYGLDAGWTYLDQKILANTCMVVTDSSSSGGQILSASPAIPGPTATSQTCYQTAGVLPLLLSYGENTNTAYINLRFKPVKRVMLNAGYELTSSSGHNNWLRMDAGNQLFQVTSYAAGSLNPGAAVLLSNTGVPLNGTAGALGPGPNPAVPNGSLDTNWHKLYAGLTYDVRKGLALKGMWSYYDYNEKDVENISVLLPRDFHTNTATISLKYSF
jgi:opacity protein-like surface antigen